MASCATRSSTTRAATAPSTAKACTSGGDEGAHLEEGTDSGTLRGNVFRRVGGSGENGADSAVDAKGNGWLIEGDRLEEPMRVWDDDGTMRPSELAGLVGEGKRPVECVG
jgi:hypothetical protein